MADKPELLHLQSKGGSSLVLSETRASLIARARKDAASLIVRKPKLIAAVMSGFRWHLIDETGASISGPDYAVVLPFSCGRAPFSISGVSLQLWQSPPEKDTGRFDRGYLFGDGYGFMDSHGRFAEFARDACLVGYGNGFSGGLWGYLDLEGNIIIPPKFEKVRGFREDLAGAMSKGLWGFINKDGTFAIKPHFTSVRDFKDGLAVAKVDGKCGFIDKHGKFVIEPRFDYLWDFSEGLACTEIDGKYGFIDRSGEFAIAPRFRNAGDFRGGIARVSMSRKLTGKCIYIDRTGEPIIDNPAIRAILDFSEGLGVFRMSLGEANQSRRRNVYRYIGDADSQSKADGEWELIERAEEKYGYGYLDPNGQIRIPARFDSAGSFKDGYARVGIAGKWQLIDKAGGIVQAPNCVFMSHFEEGLARIKIGDLYGFIDLGGKIVIEPQFESAGSFKNGLACIGERRHKPEDERELLAQYMRYGYIDKTGKVVIPIQFEEAGDFERIS